MSLIDEKIAMLEALLARIRRRSHEPREGAQTNGLHTNGATGAHDVVILDAPEPMPEEEPTISDSPVLPVIRRPEPSHVRPIEPPPMEVIELDIEPETSMPPPPMPEDDENGEDDDEGFESRSRLVSAAPVAPSDPTIEAAEPLDLPDEPLVPAEERVAPLESAVLPDDDDDEEPAPSSSRRVVTVEEKLAQLAEDDDAHEPPPESGKLPAAPVLNLAEPDVAPLRPEVSRATPPDAQVATFVGRAPEPRVATFGDLLDLTMRL